jgi:hypothetical protein
MNEAEWLACEDATDMLDFIALTAGGLDGGRGDRQLRSVRRRERLFGVACCRRIWPLIADGVRGCVEVAERFADGRATGDELRAAKEVALARWLESGGVDAATQACEWVCGEVADARRFRPPVIRAAIQPRLEARGWVAGQGLTEADNALIEVEKAEHLQLLRDIFGNPFRPVTFSPEWRTDAAVALARQMYDSRDFSAMPILADALQDAGCDNADILAHCRGSSPHVRGCWVCDLVLQKE